MICSALKMLLRGTLLAMICFCGSGCEVLGTIAHIAVGDPPIPAQYVPPKAPTLVLVENFRSPGAVQLDGDMIAHLVCEELKEKGKLDVIDPDKLVPIREEDPAKFQKMSIPELGKAVGAKQVIYVDLIESDFSSDTSQSVVHATATARVRVVDVASTQTLWPASPPGGKELSNKIDFDPVDTSHALSMRTDMLTQLSSQISKLFYTWKADNTDQETAGG
jgi:hypothetical protein